LRRSIGMYCEQCDQSIIAEILRFMRYDMRVTLCYRCMDALGEWATTRRILEATIGPMVDEQVTAAMGAGGDQLWAAWGPGDPAIRARYRLDP
jgi:hypothetical protein